jgi:hypothetical protein
MAGRIAYLGNIVTQGLVLNLDAGIRGSYPGVGTTWTDISNNGNNGTLVNGPTYSSDNYGTIVFNGVDNYVTGSFPYTLSSGWSVELWIYVDSRTTYPDDEGIWRISSNNNNRLNLRRSNTNTNSWRYEVTGPNGTTGTTGMEFNTTTDGVWSQMICTYDGISTLNVYHNNNLIKTGNFNIGNVIVSTYTIGINNFPPYFQGKVPTFRVYNRALIQTEITQNFNAYRTRYGI